jgi:hypothetical protein
MPFQLSSTSHMAFRMIIEPEVSRSACCTMVGGARTRTPKQDHVQSTKLPAGPPRSLCHRCVSSPTINATGSTYVLDSTSTTTLVVKTLPGQPMTKRSYCTLQTCMLWQRQHQTHNNHSGPTSSTTLSTTFMSFSIAMGNTRAPGNGLSASSGSCAQNSSTSARAACKQKAVEHSLHPVRLACKQQYCPRQQATRNRSFPTRAICEVFQSEVL